MSRDGVAALQYVKGLWRNTWFGTDQALDYMERLGVYAGDELPPSEFIEPWTPPDAMLGVQANAPGRGSVLTVDSGALRGPTRIVPADPRPTKAHAGFKRPVDTVPVVPHPDDQVFTPTWAETILMPMAGQNLSADSVRAWREHYAAKAKANASSKAKPEPTPSPSRYPEPSMEQFLKDVQAMRTPDTTGDVFGALLQKERARAWHRTYQSLLEYLIWPLYDRTGQLHLSRLITPWVYYKDLYIYDVLIAFKHVFSWKEVLNWMTFIWFGGFSWTTCLIEAAKAVTKIMQGGHKFAAPFLAIFEVKDINIYDGNIRSRLPGLTAPPDMKVDMGGRNLAHEYPTNLANFRGMNKTVTFRFVRPVPCP